MKRSTRIITAIAFTALLATISGGVWAASGGNLPGKAQLKVFVWEDANQNGAHEAGEQGVADVMVNLFDSQDSLVDVTLTDENGVSVFDNLDPGDYYVEYAPPEGYTFNLEVQDGDVGDPASIVKTKTKTIVAGENSQIWDRGLQQSAALQIRSKSGTVKPPPRIIKVCKDGTYSVGGVSGLKISNLKKGYCVLSFLWNHHFAFGRFPDEDGKILAPITFVQIFYHSRLVQEIPVADGTIQICYAVPPGKTVQIYFFDFSHRLFKNKGEQPSWKPLSTTIDGGTACAAAQSTGAYALIGK
jgi:hypothetical protein